MVSEVDSFFDTPPYRFPREAGVKHGNFTLGSKNLLLLLLSFSLRQLFPPMHDNLSKAYTKTVVTN